MESEGEHQSAKREAKIEQNIYVINNTINIEKVEIGKEGKNVLPSVRRSLPISIRSGSKDLTDEEAANETLRDYMKRKVTET
jgi:D-alanine-D-alanine ligase-like ATP-grasp enzyme